MHTCPAVHSAQKSGFLLLYMQRYARLLSMKRLAIIITAIFALTVAASAETDPMKISAILEGAKVCNTTADPVACMTGFMAATYK